MESLEEKKSAGGEEKRFSTRHALVAKILLVFEELKETALCLGDFSKEPSSQDILMSAIRFKHIERDFNDAKLLMKMLIQEEN